jgi:hypothetical protein
MSANASTVIFFKNIICFRIFFLLLDIRLIRGVHRRAICLADGDEPQNYRRKEKLLNFPPYYRDAKFLINFASAFMHAYCSAALRVCGFEQHHHRSSKNARDRRRKREVN